MITLSKKSSPTYFFSVKPVKHEINLLEFGFIIVIYLTSEGFFVVILLLKVLQRILKKKIFMLK